MNRRKSPLVRRPGKKAVAEIHELYTRFHSPEYLGLDPLVTLQQYNSRHDLETGGLVASALAYGRVETIVAHLEEVFAAMAHTPYSFCMETSFTEKKRVFRKFRHRFTTGDDVALLLDSIALVIKKYGSIEAFFFRALSENPEEGIAGAIDAFSDKMKQLTIGRRSLHNDYFDFLVPSARAGSACKRMNMYLRWMVRPADGIDLGVWTSVGPSLLIIPVDTHIARIARNMGMTRRATADWRMAEEITTWLRHIDRDDPVRFDFSLCRSGMVTLRRSAA